MQNIHGIRPPIPVGIDPLTLKIIGFSLAGVLMCMVLYVLIRRWLKNRQISEQIPMLSSELPPYEAAMEQLNRLSMDAIDDWRLLYFDLTLILRKYISAVFGICATEMTSQEFGRAVKSLDMDQHISHKIILFQQDCDPIKYAGIVPEKDRATADLTAIKEMIQLIEADRARVESQQKEEA